MAQNTERPSSQIVKKAIREIEALYQAMSLVAFD